MAILLFILPAINCQIRHLPQKCRAEQAAHTADFSERRPSFAMVQVVASRLSFPNSEASLVMEVFSIEAQSEGNEQAGWEENLINEVINDFLNSFDEVDVVLAQQAGLLTRACSVKNDAEPGARGYFLRSSKKNKK